MNESTIYDFMLLRWRRLLHLMLSHTPQARPDVCSRAGVIASLKHASRCSNVHSCSIAPFFRINYNPPLSPMSMADMRCLCNRRWWSGHNEQNRQMR